MRPTYVLGLPYGRVKDIAMNMGYTSYRKDHYTFKHPEHGTLRYIGTAEKLRGLQRNSYELLVRDAERYDRAIIHRTKFIKHI